jgi:hypothetical protein
MSNYNFINSIKNTSYCPKQKKNIKFYNKWNSLRIIMIKIEEKGTVITLFHSEYFLK